MNWDLTLWDTVVPPVLVTRDRCPILSKRQSKGDLTVGAVLSGNRNFEGRIHPLVKTNWLASPPLVVAYALAGNMNINRLLSLSAMIAKASRYI